MEFEKYPRWKYAQSIAIIVDTAEAEAALTGDWFDSPFDVPESDTPDVKAEKDVLLAQAAERNIVVEKRWSIAKLKEALA